MAGRTAVECPNTPLRKAQPLAPTSPLIFSPSKITHYLKHAEQNLGVRNASMYKRDLHDNSYGPDILHLVETQALVKLGIPAGDAVRLKNGAQAWWSGPDAKSLKHKASSIQPPNSPPNPKKYRFEKHYNGGGAKSYFGSAIERETPDSDAAPRDYSWWFFCPLTRHTQPLPDHHVPVLAPEELDEFFGGDNGFR